MKKRTSVILLFLWLAHPVVSMACEVCQKQQPKMLKNITHGTGPQGQVDYLIIVVALILVLLALTFSLKYLIRPGEKSKRHIKHVIIKDDSNGRL